MIIYSCHNVQHSECQRAYCPYFHHSSAAVANRRYLNYIIAGNFTDASGSSKLYVGKDNFYITPAGFPIPHDAPYKPKFQKYIFAFAEVRKSRESGDGMFSLW